MDSARNWRKLYLKRSGVGSWRRFTREWPKPTSGATPAACASSSHAATSSRSHACSIASHDTASRARHAELREDGVAEHVGLLVGDADDQRARRDREHQPRRDQRDEQEDGTRTAHGAGRGSSVSTVSSWAYGGEQQQSRINGSAPGFSSLRSTPAAHCAVARADVAPLAGDAQAPATSGEEVELLGLRVVRAVVAPPGGTVASARTLVTRRQRHTAGDLANSRAVQRRERLALVDVPHVHRAQHGTHPRGETIPKAGRLPRP